MSRPSILLMSGAAALLLIVGIVLWRSIRSETVVPTPTPTRTESPTPAAPSAPAPVVSAQRQPVVRGSQRAPITSAPSAPALPATQIDAGSGLPENPPGTPWDETNVHFGADQLHALTASVEPLVRECADKAAIAGKRASGTAMLTYTAVKHGDKVSVDETGIDGDKTTLGDPGLLSCLHQTAKAMKFEGLPRNANVIWGTRSVTIEDGKVTDYKHMSFSYRPPAPR